ncbi:MBOAT family protein [Lacipirellula sp.]|uniref:MBOAT family protein n=1 Tax=Lacipirellula sp. TaxID=2691419 RepID=UPI003D1070C4
MSVAETMPAASANVSGGPRVARGLAERWRGWGPMVVAPIAFVALAPATWPHWACMWGIAFAIYFGAKWLTWRRPVQPRVSAARSFGYLVAWPGLDAVAFLEPRDAKSCEQVAAPSRGEWSFAAFKLALGATIFFGLARLAPVVELPYLTGWIGMIGLVLMLHFGLFHLLSCAWRRAGVDAAPLMDWPIAATSMSEFWGRRWNRAFRDLAHRFLFRPLTPRLGAAGAMVAGFAFSGVVHDVVMSWPAAGGYGGPTVFFLIQAAGMLVERSRVGRRCGLGAGWRGWLFAATLLLATSPLLFHPPFVLRVIVPFMHAVGAL